jgi:hypothetical protein
VALLGPITGGGAAPNDKVSTGAAAAAAFAAAAFVAFAAAALVAFAAAAPVTLPVLEAEAGGKRTYASPEDELPRTANPSISPPPLLRARRVAKSFDFDIGRASNRL